MTSLLSGSFNLVDINNNDNNRNNSNNKIIDTFFLIWRNKFLLKCVQNKIYTGSKIVLREFDNLNEIQQECLSTFSNIVVTPADTFNILLAINSKSEFNQYINSPYKHLITEVQLSYLSETIDNVMDLGILPQGLIKLKTFFFENTTVIKGTPPSSLNEILLWGSRSDSNVHLDNFLAKLPSTITKISVPPQQRLGKQCVLPTTLCHLSYQANGCDSLKRLVVPANKIYNDCQVKLRQNDDFQWAKNQPWIVNVVCKLLYAAITPNIFSSNLKELVLKTIDREVSTSLPLTLESLTLGWVGKTGIVLPSQLKHLYVQNWDPKLEIGDLPSTLETLDMTVYRRPLDPGVLPPNLKTLYMKFNKRFQLGVLPDSLTSLNLSIYNQPLDPFVLPAGLKTLNLHSFNKPLGKDSLPNSLTDLFIQEFNSSMDGVGPLDNLRILFIKSLHPSVSNVLVNVKCLKLGIQNLSHDDSLQNTSIVHLNILGQDYESEKELEIHIGFLPSTL